MNLLAQASELFLLQKSNLIHVRQIHPMQVAASGADAGDQLTRMVESVDRSVLASTAVLAGGNSSPRCSSQSLSVIDSCSNNRACWSLQPPLKPRSIRKR